MKKIIGILGQFRSEALSMTVLLVGIILGYSDAGWFDEGIRMLWYVAAFLPVGIPVVREALESLWHGKVCNEFMLMTLAAAGAFYIGEYPEAVAVMLFYAVGEKLQEMAANSARNHISALMDLRPDRTRVVREGREEEVRSEDVRLGDVVKVRAGERLSLDGTLLSDGAEFNAAAITGESKPVFLHKGDEVMAGLTPTADTVLVAVVRSFEHSALSRILKLVEEAADRKAPAELFIRKFARVYTPVVVGISVLVVLVPWLCSWMSGSAFLFSDWLYRALVFLVVSCPCALVISIPLGYFGGIGAASTKGILFKGGCQLDTVTKVDAIAFDKTGTLTTGLFKVEGIMEDEGGRYTRDEILRYVALAELSSNHPIAKTVREYAEAHGMTLSPERAEMRNVAGMGLKGRIDGDEVLVGNRRLLEQEGIAVPEEIAGIEDLTILCGVNHAYAGCIVLEDTAKEGVADAVKELKSMGIENLYLLSGDKQNIVAKLAHHIGIGHVAGDLLPEQKADFMRRLKEHNRYVTAFVGDGINDAPVLATCDVGIAMGAMGSDVAIETADIVIQDDNIAKIAEAVNIGRKTRRIVTENIVFAIGVKVVVMVLGALGMTNLWVAVFADVGVSLLAILNALRLRLLVAHRDVAGQVHRHVHPNRNEKGGHHHCGCGCH